MSLYSLFARKGPTGYSYRDTADTVSAGLDLSGKAILLTGVSSGLGSQALRVLVQRGAKVLAVARTPEKAKAACDPLGPLAVPLSGDLAEPKSMRELSAAVLALGLPLDAIIANAGIMALPKRQQAYGYELQFFNNHIGHFILVTNLLGRLADKGRVVILSSSAHQMAPAVGIEFDNLGGERGYSAWRAYGQSKLANMLFAKELHRRFVGTGKTAYAVHPGVIHTRLARHMNLSGRLAFSLVGPLFLKTPAQGAATEVFAAVHPAAPAYSGWYLADSNPAKNDPKGDDPDLARKLWEVSEEIAVRLGGRLA